MLAKTNKPKKLFDLKVCKQLDAIFTFNLLIWKKNIWQKIKIVIKKKYLFNSIKKPTIKKAIKKIE